MTLPAGLVPYLISVVISVTSCCVAADAEVPKSDSSNSSSTDTMSSLLDARGKDAEAQILSVQTILTKTVKKHHDEAAPDRPDYAKEAAQLQLAAAANDVRQAEKYRDEARAVAPSNPAYSERLLTMAMDKYNNASRWAQKAGGGVATSGASSSSTGAGRSAVQMPDVCKEACQELKRIEGQPKQNLKLPNFEDFSRDRLPVNPPAGGQTEFFQSKPQNNPKFTNEAGREALALPQGGKLDLAQLKAAVVSVDPSMANKPLFSQCGGAACPSADFLRTISDPDKRSAIDKIGGVALAATFDILAASGYPELRSDSRVSIADEPVLVSLKALLRAVAPYADSPKWGTLPQALRFPGNIDRVTGYVLDRQHDDVLLVGREAKLSANRIDVDEIVVCIRQVWREGKVMAVSLDPRPDRIGGAQYPRLIDVPSKSVAATIMLDADYAMKAINMNAGWARNSNLIDFEKIYTDGADKAEEELSRLWLTPRYLGKSSILRSGSGRTLLVETSVEVRTESMVVNNGELIGTGSKGLRSTRFANEFTERYPTFESDSRIQPSGIFTRLHGLVDLSTISELLRTTYARSNTLQGISELPLRTLSDSEAYPDAYTGLSGTIHTSRRIFDASGGVQMIKRESALAQGANQDRFTSILESAADQMTLDHSVLKKVEAVLALPVVNDSEAANASANDILLVASNATDRGDFPRAEQEYRKLIGIQPAEPEGYVHLANLALMQGNPLKAAPYAILAMYLAPEDANLRLLALDIAWQANPNIIESTLRQAEQWDLSNYYLAKARFDIGIGDRDDAMRLLNWAIELWEDNGHAYLALARLEHGPIARAVHFARAVESFRKQLKAGAKNIREPLALSLTILASIRVGAFENLYALHRSTDKLNAENLQMLDGFLAEASSLAKEAQGLNETLVDAAELEILIELRRHEFQAAVLASGGERALAGPGIDLHQLLERAKALVARFPASVVALETISEVQHAMRNDADALGGMNAALRIEPFNVYAMIERGKLKSYLGDCEGSTKDLEVAKKYAGDDVGDYDFSIAGRCGSKIAQ